MADRRASHDAGGFTLLELLIVIVILSLIVTMLTGGVRFAGRAWEKQERQIDQQGDASAVQTVVRQLIASAHGFDGDSTALRFVGPLPHALKRGGLFDIELKTDADRLIISWRPHFKGSGPTAELAATDLVKGVARFDLSYYMVPDKEPAGWQSGPVNAANPPALISLRLQLAGGRPWPPLIITPMIDSAPKQ